MILGDDEIRWASPKARASKVEEVDLSDREAFMVTLPKHLLAESTVPWPRWLAPPGASVAELAVPVSGGYSENPTGRRPLASTDDAQRSPPEFPAPTGA